MSLFNSDEVKIIAKKCGFMNDDCLQYNVVNYSDELVGYLGEHLRLHLKTSSVGENHEVILFVKCMPRFDAYKAEYLRESGFFEKEYILLRSLFNQFEERKGAKKWRPECLFLNNQAFVFEDVTQIGYAITDTRKPFTYDETIAAIEAVAKFHADSIIYEHKKSQELKRLYTIWEDFSPNLTEPVKGQPWRDTGRNGVIDVLKMYSAYKDLPNFNKVEDIITDLFDLATAYMQPSTKYKNVVVHRDIWSNNVFFKTNEDGTKHALLVDFQTAIYTPPTHDLTSLIFFNTTKNFRKEFTGEMLDKYYTCLRDTLDEMGLDVTEFMDKKALLKSYEDSIIFGITQAALILPIANMPESIKDKYCRKSAKEFDSVTRSHCFIESLEEDKQYRDCILEIFDDIVERFVLPVNLN